MSEYYFRMCNYIMQHDMLNEGDTLLAAVSGGADSMCMLDLLIRYCAEHDIRLGVVHVNHGFREEAQSEAEYVSGFCDARDIPFYLKAIEPGSISKTEEAARIRRYELISEVAADYGYEKVALAHNERDRAETMLFNMFRGTGISGLTGIRPVREMYIRPIMCLDRGDIEAHLQTEGIAYCTDRTNLEDDYARNRIRHHIITGSESINERSVHHMNELAEDIGDICDLIRDLASDACEQAVISTDDHREYSIRIEDYTKQRPVIRSELIRMIILDMTPHLKDITREHIRSIDELAYRETNGRVDLPYGIRAYREYDHIRIISDESKDAEDPASSRGENTYREIQISPDNLSAGGEPVIVRTDDGSEIRFSVSDAEVTPKAGELKSADKYTKRFDYDKIKGLMTLRYRGPGDQIVIDEAGHEKKLSRYMIESKIPERLRDSIPILAAGSDVIWIIGYRDSCAYRIDAGTQRILEVTVETIQ